MKFFKYVIIMCVPDTTRFFNLSVGILQLNYSNYRIIAIGILLYEKSGEIHF